MLVTVVSIAIPGLIGLFFLVVGLVEYVNYRGYCLGPTTKLRLVIGVPENKRANKKEDDYNYSVDEHGQVVFWLDAPGNLPVVVAELAIAVFLLTVATNNLIFLIF